MVMLFPYHVNHLALLGRSPCIVAPSSSSRAIPPSSISIFAAPKFFERRISGLSLETFAEDLDAVLAALRLERVALVAIGARDGGGRVMLPLGHRIT